MLFSAAAVVMAITFTSGSLAVASLTALMFIYVFWDSFSALLLSWAVSRGYKNPVEKKGVRLYCFFCRPKNLDEISYEQLYVLGKHGIAAPSLSDFVAYAKLYNCAAIFRCCKTGTLHGIVLWDLKKGGKCTFVQFGGMVFRNHLNVRCFRMICFAYALKVWLLNPFVSVTFTFPCRKPSVYAAFARMTKKMYPRFDADTPLWEKSIIDKLGQRFATKVSVGRYDPETCIASADKVNPDYREDFDEMTKDEAESSNDPHLKYFYSFKQKRLGSALLCVVHIDKQLLARVIGILR
ncbi:uncharacterized protein [Oscarella lobularis]|uniref:uncharacterized protein n=1 Tax=Oscarella lobularis TaxID=121494 RepID=UPI0033144E2F